MTFNFTAGQEIYKFKLLTKLGNGSFGEVWLSEDMSINKQVALKILPSDFSHIPYVLEEAKNGNKVSHRNLLEIFYADIYNVESNLHLVLIAQAYQEKGSVIGLLNARNFLPLPLLLKILKDIAAGLEYLHNGNIIHNDIKPGNILIDKNDNAVLSDYGISSVLESTSSSISPKNIYMLHGAPEVISGKTGISVSTDIFQLGCTAYRLANGIDELSFSAIATKEELIKNKNDRKMPPSTHQPYVPKKLQKIINKCTEVDVSKRYSSVLEFRRDLEKICFPGYWTVDETDTSKLIGIGKDYVYEYILIPKPGNMFDVESRRKSKITNKLYRITAYCKKNIKLKEKDKLIKDYFEWVINNAK